MPESTSRIAVLEARLEEMDRRYTERFVAQEKALVLALTTYPTKQDLQALVERVVRAEGVRSGGAGLLGAIALAASTMLSILAVIMALLR